KTPFYNKHKELDAKIVNFAGFMMPISYEGINAEHLQVRKSVGVFDVSHMGEFSVEGENALEYLQNLTINDVSALVDGQVQYTAMCYENGGIVDDLLLYRFNSNKFLMVVNGSNIDKDFEWSKKHLIENVELKNNSDKIGLLAIQGPNSFKTLQKLTDVNINDLDFYHFTEGKLAEIEMIISRTGYTGELGFELYHDIKDSVTLWDKVFEAGEEFDIKPVGLGARDTLRMEMKYCLYGNDIDKTTNPIEAGLSWITKFDCGNFIGRDAILKVKNEKPSRRLVIFKMEGKRIARHGYKIFVGEEEVGIVTSGTQSPTLKEGIGIGYVKRGNTKSGKAIDIDIRGKKYKAIIVKPPVVKSSPF
ncbi:MAG: glycine cleavage system aminomethyltransferase GcvT, partial [Candidatus Marinimicrobia bacterium]|nr:glycine cleavage system aminomethyltransferase GcvT [Candidatus Neomarinimicrobiota bacterium]